MKTCTVCQERFSEDEGAVNDEGKFVCFACADENSEETTGPTVCPECEEPSDELARAGICPSCGYEAETEKDGGEQE